MFSTDLSIHLFKQRFTPCPWEQRPLYSMDRPRTMDREEKKSGPNTYSTGFAGCLECSESSRLRRKIEPVWACPQGQLAEEKEIRGPLHQRCRARVNAAWHGSNVLFYTGIPIAQVTRRCRPAFSWIQYQAHSTGCSTSILPRIDHDRK